MENPSAFGVEVGYPDMRDQPIFGRRNLFNIAVSLWVPVPALLCVLALYHWFPPGAMPANRARKARSLRPTARP